MATKELTSWDDVDRTSLETMSFQEMMDAGVIAVDELDNVIQADQADLVGIPFILFDWDIKTSETYGGTYAVCRVKTGDDKVKVFADGGTGIQEQLKRYEINARQKGVSRMPIYLQRGLRASTYTTEVDGKMIPATTYYFDNKMD